MVFCRLFCKQSLLECTDHVGLRILNVSFIPWLFSFLVLANVMGLLVNGCAHSVAGTGFDWLSKGFESSMDEKKYDG